MTEFSHLSRTAVPPAQSAGFARASGTGTEWTWPVAALIAVAGLAYLYSPSFAPLLHYWDRPEYGHGYIIPFIALLLAWHDLSDRRPVASSHWRGLIFLLLGFCALAVSQLSTFNALAVYGLILALVGLCDCFLGRAVTRVLTPAFVYLLFAVPLPDFLYVDLSARMQLVSSTLGVHLLELAGVPVFQDGNVIDLGGLKLQVAEACSGLRYLFPLASLGFLAAYLLKDAFWKRALLLLSTVPITILLNAVRIAVIGITADRWGPEMAEGMIHMVEGWVVFGLCSLCLLLEIAILRRIGSGTGRFRLDYLGPARFPLLTGRPSMTANGWLAGSLIVLLSAGAAFGFAGRNLAAEPHTAAALQPALAAAVPLRLGTWMGHRQSLDPDVIDALGLSDYIVTDYFRDGRDDVPAVNLYIGYWANQSVGSAAHSPANCIPGGGWLIIDKKTVTLPTPGSGTGLATAPMATSTAGAVAGSTADGAGLRVNRLLIGREDQRQLVYYWFDQRGRDLTSEWAVKWYLLHDRMTTGRSDGFLVRLVTPVASQGSGQISAQALQQAEAEADRRLQQFLDDSAVARNLTMRLPAATVTQ
ncbi:MAG TPA: EpsI family protein [Terriglobales bacterium]|nr:EpsI family protein [Terriglobales bacterium]